MAMQLVQQLQLHSQKSGVLYVRSYTTRKVVSEARLYPIYEAAADDKGGVLQEWACGAGSWNRGDRCIGTSINIESVVYVVHTDRPYGLTGFAQQSRRCGRYKPQESTTT